MSVVRLIGATVQRTLRVGRAAVRVLLVRTASSVSLQSLLLLLNICFFYSGKSPSFLARPSRWSLRTECFRIISHLTPLYLPQCAAGVKKLRRARFTAAVKLLTDLDEEGLKTLINFLPAWVKVHSFFYLLCAGITSTYGFAWQANLKSLS